MTPKFKVYVKKYQHEKTWVSTPARPLSEAYHSLRWLTSREIPTLGMLLKPPLSVRRRLVSLHAHWRDIHSAYPWHQLRIVIDQRLNVVISDSQSTKHRVTLFHYVVPVREYRRPTHGTLNGRCNGKYTAFFFLCQISTKIFSETRI